LAPDGLRAVSYTHLDVYKRQEQVEQDEVGPAHRQPLEGLEPAGRGQNLEPELAQGSADDLDIGLLVIDDE